MNQPWIKKVSVRSLAEFVWRRGDLGGDRDFVPRGRLLLGSQIHRRIQNSRPAAYQSEVRLEATEQRDGIELHISGRLDGMVLTTEQVQIEEIKTTDRFWKGQPDEVHWAQVKLYAGLLALRDSGIQRFDLRLCYVGIETETVVNFDFSLTAEEIRAFWGETLDIYMRWLVALRDWVRARDASLRDLKFPFPNFRANQRGLSVAVYRAIRDRQILLVEAPTGIGKTMSVLFPALKGMGEGLSEGIFYLTAKNSGQTSALSALSQLRDAGLKLRVIQCIARERICQQSGLCPTGDSCPFTQGYYDRLPQGLNDLLQIASSTTVDASTILEVASKHRLCPHALSKDAVPWADLVIGDYNYAFDPSAAIPSLMEAREDRVLLVDEAHNLLDRARAMHSVALHPQALKLAADQLAEVALPVAKSLMKAVKAVSACLKKLDSEVPKGQEDQLEFDSGERKKDQTPGSLISVALRRALKSFLDASEEWLALSPQTGERTLVLDPYFSVLAFVRVAEEADHRWKLFKEELRGEAGLKLLCLDPSPELSEIMTSARAVILFSGTLSPLDFHHTSLLGAAAAVQTVKVPSPFIAEQMKLKVVTSISTEYQHREANYPKIAVEVARFLHSTPGNCLVYFPSFEFLRRVTQELVPALLAQGEGREVISQKPGMTEPERQEYLDRFKAPSEGVIGLAVLGGIFAEGVDLVGERLVGVVIVGIGLPQLSEERDWMARWHDAAGRNGFNFAYLFPGLTRVVQAAGRLIRSESDRGSLLLIDRRYADSRVKRLLPEWWV